MFCCVDGVHGGFNCIRWVESEMKIDKYGVISSASSCALNIPGFQRETTCSSLLCTPDKCNMNITLII